MESHARMFLEELAKVQKPFEFLLNLHETHEHLTEREWLDFKVGSVLRTGESINFDSVKKSFREALSGFGNTCDGLLIFGIDARKDESGHDKIIGPALYPRARKLAADLQSLLKEAVSPPIVGVQIDAYVREGSEEGFVVCFVPEGRDKSYRADLGDRRYYIRIGESFLEAPISILRSLFYPISTSTVVPLLEITQRSFVVKVCNKGPLTAKSVHVSVNTNWLEHYQYTLKTNDPIFKFNGDFARPKFDAVHIHPGKCEIICQLRIMEDIDTSNSILITVTIFSMDAHAYKWEFRLNSEDFAFSYKQVEAYERIPV